MERVNPLVIRVQKILFSYLSGSETNTFSNPTGKKELLLASFFNWSMGGEDGVLYAKGQVPLLMFPTVAETLFAALKPGDGDQEGQAMR